MVFIVYSWKKYNFGALEVSMSPYNKWHHWKTLNNFHGNNEWVSCLWRMDGKGVEERIICVPAGAVSSMGSFLSRYFLLMI